MDTNAVGTFIICIILLFVLGKLFIWPLKKIMKLILNSILGGALIYLINIIGMNFGFHIGLNLLTAIIVGLLGVPGAVLLVLLKIIIGWMLKIIKASSSRVAHFFLCYIYLYFIFSALLAMLLFKCNLHYVLLV